MLVYDIALSMIPKIGSRRAKELIEKFGSAEEVFKTHVDDIAIMTELPQSAILELLHNNVFPDAEKEIRLMKEHGIKAVTMTSEEYPYNLLQCPDAPTVLYVKGDIDFNSSFWLSVVGTRKATPYGKKCTDDIIDNLAGLNPKSIIVSGLATGIDITAHLAALRNGLKTVAVLGNPLSWVYPSQHKKYAEEIMENGGALVSDFNSFCKMHPSNFLQRNRIIAGLSSGTLVVESQKKGGSLSTARCAFEYNREVMAVPGRVGDPMSEGTNDLIAISRAHLVTNGTDIMAALNWDIKKNLNLEQKGDSDLCEELSEDERAVIKLLRVNGALNFDELATLASIPVYKMSSMVSVLELKGNVRINPGNLVEKI